MNILGLSFDYHDAAAAIVCDGRIIAAAQEERFSRLKNDAALPEHAIRFCMEQAGLSAKYLDSVVFYERPLLKFDRIRHHAIQFGERGQRYLKEAFRAWVAHGKFEPLQRIGTFLDLPSDRLHTIEHHQAHAASAFFCSPFDEATVITLDGVGEYETLTVSLGQGVRLEKLYSLTIPDSVGLLYSAFTAFLGFEVNEGEYKVMGMSGFGQPNQLERLKSLVHFAPDGTFSLSGSHFDFLCPEDAPYTKDFLKLIGSPRVPESPFLVGSGPAKTGTPEAQSASYASIAASIQKLTEELILHVVSVAVKRTGLQNVCLAGGVALNSLANGRIERDLGLPLFVQPAAGDAGGALGAALYHQHCVNHRPREWTFEHAYLGRGYSVQWCRDALLEGGIRVFEEFHDEASLLETVATLLAAGAVVGWLHGRFEWGPRALGARSILADPRRADMQRVVNEKIKFREPFRPFAPSVLVHRSEEYFELPAGRRRLCPEDFMLSVSPVRPDMRSKVPAITHVDGTARVQLVRKETAPRYFALIEAFERITGVPLLLNTSFNRRGEPIVASPRDAVETFQWTGLVARGGSPWTLRGVREESGRPGHLSAQMGSRAHVDRSFAYPGVSKDFRRRLLDCLVLENLLVKREV